MRASLASQPIQKKWAYRLKLGCGSLNVTLKVLGNKVMLAVHLADNAAHHLIKICDSLLAGRLIKARRIFNRRPYLSPPLMLATPSPILSLVMPRRHLISVSMTYIQALP